MKPSPLAAAEGHGFMPVLHRAREVEVRPSPGLVPVLANGRSLGWQTATSGQDHPTVSANSITASTIAAPTAVAAAARQPSPSRYVMESTTTGQWNLIYQLLIN